jgi:hypothetical protein
MKTLLRHRRVAVAACALGAQVQSVHRRLLADLEGDTVSDLNVGFPGQLVLVDTSVTMKVARGIR